jgi:hypothetical protein
MKSFAKILLASGLMFAAGLAADQASAQCHDGFFNCNPAPSRYLHFRVDGRAFVFDRVTSGIFCDGVKIGVRDPSGKVTLFGGVPAPAGGAVAGPGNVVAGGAPVAGGAIQAGGPAIAGSPAGQGAPGIAGPSRIAGTPGIPGGQGVVGGQGVAGAPIGAGSAAPGVARQGANVGGPVGGQAVGGQAIGPGSPGTAGAGAAAAPAPAPAPVAAGGNPAAAVPTAVPALGSGNDPLAAAAQASLPQFDLGLLAGQWRAETKDIAGRVVVRELSFDEERNATLRIQAQGQEPISIQGPFDMSNNQFVVTDGDEKRDLGQFTIVEKDRLVLKGEGETVNFTRVEEAPEAAE